MREATDAESLNVAEDLAFKAGKSIVEARQEQLLKFSYKDGVELLTSADLSADRLIRAGIESAFPDHSILSEESSPDLSDPDALLGPLWIIDPIDGTVNYAYNHHQVAVSIAFACEGVVRAGVVHCPFQEETFSAVRGGGALLNGAPICASRCSELARALIGTGFPYDRDGRVALVDRLRKVLFACRDIRRIGSAAADICWVAMGRLDGYYETIQPWDFAAAALIAREAGARIGHLGGVPAGQLPELWGRELVVAAPGIYTALRALLRD